MPAIINRATHIVESDNERHYLRLKGLPPLYRKTVVRMLHPVIKGGVGCKHASKASSGHPSYDKNLHKEDPDVLELISGPDAGFVPSAPESLPLPFSELADHIDQSPPQILVHITHDDFTVNDKESATTSQGIVIARYTGAGDDPLDVIRSFENVELLLNQGSANGPGMPFVLKGGASKVDDKKKDASETCQTPVWQAKSLDRFSSGGWHIRLFTLSADEGNAAKPNPFRGDSDETK